MKTSTETYPFCGSQLQQERAWPHFDRRAGHSWRLLGVMTLVIIAEKHLLAFGHAIDDFRISTLTLATVVVFAMLLRGVGLKRLGAALEGGVLVLAGCMAVGCLTTLFATTSFPYRDDQLAYLDSLIVPSMRWIDMTLALRHSDRLVAAMGWIYSSLNWQPFLLVIILAALGHLATLWEFVHGWLIALVICAIIFPFVPALGPYVHNHLAASDIPALTVHQGWHPTEVLDAIRQGSIKTLDPAKMSGMVSVPSFHTAGAILLAWAFRQVPKIGAAFVALDAGIILSAPMIGSHYFVDIAAGIITGCAAIALAQALAGGAGTVQHPSPNMRAPDEGQPTASFR